MFKDYAYQGVDAIQSAKKQVVTAFVHNDKLSDVLYNFVDAQAAYTKSAIDAGFDAFNRTSEILKDASPFIGYMKQFESYFPNIKPTTPSKKAK